MDNQHKPLNVFHACLLQVETTSQMLQASMQQVPSTMSAVEGAALEVQETNI
jgi:hypothetical protein